MATVTTTPGKLTAVNPEVVHRIFLWIVILAATAFIAYLALIGLPYYSLNLEERPFSPLHQQLRSSGTIGLKLGFLAIAMFAVLFLYPLRKRVRWLSRIGVTRRWLRLHVFFGIVTPMVVTFHTAFRFHGLAGIGYWTMIAVALSGFVGRYVYAKIPRSLNSVTLTLDELASQTVALANRLHNQQLFSPEDLEPLLNVPTVQQIRRMNLFRALGTMLMIDLSRPFLVSRLRLRVLHGPRRIATLGGLLASHDHALESIVSNVRRQSRLYTAMAFLDRTQRIFHLWHVIHRPFSISFVILILVHIGVQISVGLR